MNAWGKTLDASGKSGVSIQSCLRVRPVRAVPRRYHSILLYHPRLTDSSYQIRFIADPALKFTGALDLSFDAAAIFGGDRSKRYALVVEDGKVKEAYVEPDNTGVKGMYSLRLAFLWC